MQASLVFCIIVSRALTSALAPRARTRTPQTTLKHDPEPAHIEKNLETPPALSRRAVGAFAAVAASAAASSALAADDLRWVRVASDVSERPALAYKQVEARYGLRFTERPPARTCEDTRRGTTQFNRHSHSSTSVERKRPIHSSQQ